MAWCLFLTRHLSSGKKTKACGLTYAVWRQTMWLNIFDTEQGHPKGVGEQTASFEWQRIMIIMGYRSDTMGGSRWCDVWFIFAAWTLINRLRGLPKEDEFSAIIYRNETGDVPQQAFSVRVITGNDVAQGLWHRPEQRRRVHLAIVHFQPPSGHCQADTRPATDIFFI